MTTSTDKPRKNKKKGPLRLEAIIPVGVLFLSFGLYFKFFFDSHLKHSLEWAGTQIHGAEVNIDSIETRFFAGRLQLKGLQITNKKNPKENILQFESFVFHFLWDALLRAKFVIDEASLNNIQVFVPRRRVGRVLTTEEKGESKFLKETEGKALQVVKKEYEQNVLGDIVSIVDGTDPSDQLKKLQTNLKSDQKIKELTHELKVKEKEWKERIDSLPKPKELEGLEREAKALDFKKDPLGAANKALKIAKKVEDTVDSYKNAHRSLKDDISQYKNIGEEIEAYIKEDLADIQNRLQIPDLDLGDLSEKIFLAILADKVFEIEKYVSMAKKYIPPPKKEGQKPDEIVPRKRKEGRVYHFPITTSYPVFWLKKMQVSSEADASQYSGDLSGALTHVTSHPQFVGAPAEFKAHGHFPHKKLENVHLKVSYDARKPQAETLLNMKIGAYPVGEMPLSKGEEASLLVQRSQGMLDLSGSVIGDQLQFKILNTFSKVDYQVEARSKIVKDIVQNVVSGIDTIDVLARVSGTLGDLNWRIRSNLGQALAQGFKKELQRKLEDAKKKAREYVDKQIQGGREKFDKEFQKLQSQIDQVLDKNKAELDAAKDKALGSTKDKQKNSTKKAVDKLLKKLF